MEDDRVVHSGLIKSKPTGARPCDETSRMMKILAAITEIVYTYRPGLVIIEGIAFMAKNTTALAQLAGLNYLVRGMLYEEGIDFLVVAPSSLKKFITGKGNVQKDVMMLETYKQYGLSLLDDNVVDAHALARVGLALKGGGDTISATKKSVINLISSQI